MVAPKMLQVQQIDFVTLLNEIDGLLESRLKSFPTAHPPKESEEYLTREETAKILKCSLPTLWDWTKKDLLQSYRIGNKVRYLRSEVMSSPKAIDNGKEGVQR
jgi:excisionase family DNA binding protein